MLTELSALHPLAELLVKATLLLSTTAVVTLLLRKHSAALRHLVWLCCAVGLLVLPVLIFALPPIDIPVASLSAKESTDLAPSGAATSTATSDRLNLKQQTANLPQTTPTQATVTAIPPKTSLPRSNKAPERGSSALGLGLIWLAGTAIFLAARFGGDRYLSNVIQRCRRVESHQPASALLASCAAAVGLKNPPTLLTSDVAPLPFACGPIQAAIILPEAALSWDVEKLRPVLMHEIAHIKRRDCLTQFVAHCARALFWFHPLTWWMTRQMHLEREIACDDMVLENGHEPSRYGKILLRLATESNSPGYLPAGAIAMAAKSTLESRLRALIDPLRKRRGVSRKILAAALSVTVLIAVTLAMLKVVGQPTDSDKELALQPQKIRSLPTERVIRLGIIEPELPWAWQELKARATAGKLTVSQADSLLSGLTAAMRKHPYGHDRPLTWLQGLIEALQERKLASDERVIEFLQACHGSPEPPRLPRLRVMDKTVPLEIDWRNVWHQNLYGFVLLNEMKSVTVDGQPVEVKGAVDGAVPEFRGDVQLPPLNPGRHVLRCEILSALVAKSDSPGLASDASSDTWPPARVKWMRPIEAELMVYEKDATIVHLTEDPALDPGVTGGLSVDRIFVRRAREGAHAAVVFNMTDTLKAPLSLKVALQVGGRRYELGQFWRVPIQTRTGNAVSFSGHELTARINVLPPEVQTADIVLTPNPQAVERLPDINQIWGKEIVMKQVPLARHDLLNVTSTASQPR